MLVYRGNTLEVSTHSFNSGTKFQTLNSACDFRALIGCCYVLVSTLPNAEIYVIIQVLHGT